MGSRKLLSKWPGILQINGVIYLLVVGILVFSVNREQAHKNRLNYLKVGIEDYLLEFQSGSKSPDPQIFHRAVRYYKALIHLSPENAVYYGNLGFCYFQLGQMAKAIRAYDRAIILEPKLYTLHWDLGMIHYAIHDHKRAAENFITSLALIPQSLISYQKLADSFKSPVNGEDGEMMIQRMRRQAQADEEKGLHYVAQTYFQLSMYPSMFETVRHGLNKFPNDVMFQYDLALALWARENPQKAEKILTEVIAREPDFYDAYIYLRRIKLVQNKVEAAMLDSRKILELKKRGLPVKEKFPLHLNREWTFLRHQVY
jgi:tetratricopeptide (TPR) repeat protein